MSTNEIEKNNTTTNPVERLSENSYVFLGPTNIGIITNTSTTPPEVYLVDSGHSAEYGEKIFNAICELFPNGFTLKAILNTHGHTDHAGGDNWLQQKTSCAIWTVEDERYLIEHPDMQMFMAWGGLPFSEITKSKYYNMEHPHVTNYIEYGKQMHLSNGSVIDFIHLPGHTNFMTGITFTEACDVGQNKATAIFLGDSIFGKDFLKHYWIPFLVDIGKYKSTLEQIPKMPANHYVPSHGEIITQNEIDALAEFNLIATLETEAVIVSCLDTPKTTEDVLKAVADLNGIPLKYTQFVLIGSTIRSYLTELYAQGKITHFISENKMYWQVASV